MLRVGDIVTVKPEYKGSNALFQIVEDTEENQSERYRIVFLKVFKEISKFDSVISKTSENFLWSEEDLILIRTIDSIQCEAHTISYEYGLINERIKRVIKNTIENYSNNIEESFWTARSINFDQYEYEIYENEQENKEENNMNKENEIDKILNIYFEKKDNKILEEAEKEMNKVSESDPIQQLIKEMNNQLKIIVENAGEDFNDFPEIIYDNFTKATNAKKLEIIEKRNIAFDKSKEQHQEVRALVMLADTYEERIKALKNNGILDNKGNFKD